MIIERLGSNRVLGSKTLLISANKWGGYFEASISPSAQDFATLELNKLPLTKAKSERLNSLRCELRCFLDEVRRFFEQNPQ